MLVKLGETLLRQLFWRVLSELLATSAASRRTLSSNLITSCDEEPGTTFQLQAAESLEAKERAADIILLPAPRTLKHPVRMLTVPDCPLD